MALTPRLYESQLRLIPGLEGIFTARPTVALLDHPGPTSYLIAVQGCFPGLEGIQAKPLGLAPQAPLLCGRTPLRAPLRAAAPAASGTDEQVQAALQAQSAAALEDPPVPPNDEQFEALSVSTCLVGGDGGPPTHVALALAVWVATGDQGKDLGSMKLHWGCIADAKRMKWQPLRMAGATFQTAPRMAGKWCPSWLLDPRGVCPLGPHGPLGRAWGFCPHTNTNRWIKDRKTGKDFFLPTSGLAPQDASQPSRAARKVEGGGGSKGGDEGRSDNDKKREEEKRAKDVEIGNRGKELLPFIMAFKPTQHPPEALMVDAEPER
eukprot:gene31139-6278_t